ncbi:hypothetical protein ACWEFL_15835 [Streptomyces sp. NPDC004838]
MTTPLPLTVDQVAQFQRDLDTWAQQTPGTDIPAASLLRPPVLTPRRRLPACFTCHQHPDQINQQEHDAPEKGVTLSFDPCGHAFTAPAQTLAAGLKQAAADTTSDQAQEPH